jgi:cardiolipin synthase
LAKTDTSVINNVRDHVSAQLNADGATNRVLTIPNLISALRICLIPAFAYCMGTHKDVVAIVLVVICSLSDFLDGFLARRWHQVTKVGKILDPIADRLMIFFTLIMLVVRGYLSVIILLLIFLREAMLFFQYAALILNGKGTIPVKYIGKVGAAGLLASLPLLFFVNSPALLGGYSFSKFFVIFVNILIVASVVVYWISGIMYTKEASSILASLHARRKVLVAAVITVVLAAAIIALIVEFVPIF